MRGGRLLVVLALLLGVLGSGASAHDAELHLVSTAVQSDRLTELTFTTPALSAPTKVRVLLPRGYARSRARFPVLWLLHGGQADQTAWTELGDAERLTASLPVIVVMPDGGTGGNYTDWYNAGEGGPPMWETYHLRQLLPWVDAHYRTIATRSHRAVAGYSMGGNGAMHYAARHPDLFGVVASFSGAVDTNDPVMVPITETSGWDTGALPGSIFGPRLTEEVRWRGSNPVDLAENLRGLHVTFTAGTGEAGGPDGNGFDVTERLVHGENVSLHDRLTELRIPHTWDDYGPGAHTYYYWQRELREWLPAMMRALGRVPAVPPTVSHSAIEDDYAIHGWQVRLNRAVVEFSALRDAGVSGFTLLGSGRAEVTSPPAYRPGSRLRLSVTQGGLVRPGFTQAGRDGRLRVSVVLGPDNAFQQYTLPARLTGTAVHQVRVDVVAG